MQTQTPAPYEFAGYTDDGLAVFQDGGPEIMHAIPAPPVDLLTEAA